MCSNRHIAAASALCPHRLLRMPGLPTTLLRYPQWPTSLLSSPTSLCRGYRRRKVTSSSPTSPWRRDRCGRSWIHLHHVCFIFVCTCGGLALLVIVVVLMLMIVVGQNLLADMLVIPLCNSCSNSQPTRSPQVSYYRPNRPARTRGELPERAHAEHGPLGACTPSAKPPVKNPTLRKMCILQARSWPTLASTGSSRPKCATQWPPPGARHKRWSAEKQRTRRDRRRPGARDAPAGSRRDALTARQLPGRALPRLRASCWSLRSCSKCIAGSSAVVVPPGQVWTVCLEPTTAKLQLRPAAKSVAALCLSVRVRTHPPGYRADRRTPELTIRDDHQS